MKLTKDDIKKYGTLKEQTHLNESDGLEAQKFLDDSEQDRLNYKNNLNKNVEELSRIIRSGDFGLSNYITDITLDTERIKDDVMSNHKISDTMYKTEIEDVIDGVKTLVLDDIKQWIDNKPPVF